MATGLGSIMCNCGRSNQSWQQILKPKSPEPLGCPNVTLLIGWKACVRDALVQPVKFPSKHPKTTVLGYVPLSDSTLGYVTRVTPFEEMKIFFNTIFSSFPGLKNMTKQTKTMTWRVLALLCLSVPLAAAEHWAVIVAGSKGYENYRHQADACHAYHVVRRHGIPRENVVLMMYDDVASHSANPFPGKLFNKPTRGNESSSDAVDVYAGCEVDYRGEDVTPDTFVNVLLGNSSGLGGRKVLNSTADDRVFVNFIDHGSRGNIYFPKGEPLPAKRLNKTLKKMHSKKMYKELVFYLECAYFMLESSAATVGC